MDHFDVNFLNAIGITEVWNADFNVRCTVHLTAIFPGQGDHFHALLTRGGDRFDHVSGVTGRGDTEKHIAFTAYGFNVAGKMWS